MQTMDLCHSLVFINRHFNNQYTVDLYVSLSTLNTTFTSLCEGKQDKLEEKLDTNYGLLAKLEAK